MHVHRLPFLGLLAGASAFGGHRIGWQKRGQRASGSTTRTMMSLDVAADISSTVLSRAGPFLGDSTFVGVPHRGSLDSLPSELVATAARGAAEAIVDDPRLESEVLADFSHVAIDLVSFAAPAKAMLRLSVVIGRVAAIMADYVPDHAILPEELAFQALMLGVSTSLLVRSFRPMTAALLTSTSYRDRRAYHALFREYGLSWMQFKILQAVAADWVEIAPGQVIDSRKSSSENDGEDFVYWLQKGEAELIVNDSAVQSVRAPKPGKETSQQEGCIGIFGEIEFARKLQECKKKRKSSKSSKIPTDEKAMNVASQTSSKVKAGPSGATLLRINTTKLLKLMDDDEQLADSIRSIIFAGMEEKLSKMVVRQSMPQNATSAGAAVPL